MTSELLELIRLVGGKLTDMSYSKVVKEAALEKMFHTDSALGKAVRI